MKILFLHKYVQQAAAYRYRFSQYFPFLKDHGVQVSSQSLLPANYLKKRFTGSVPPVAIVANAYWRRIQFMRRLAQQDLIVLYMEALPYLPYWLEKQLIFKSTPYIVDLDDAIYLNSPLKHKFGHIFRNARAILAGNQTLADYTKKFNSHVAVLPTVVDLGYYNRLKQFGNNKHPLTIGWVGSPSTAKSLKPISSVLKKVVEKFNCKIILIGSGLSTFDVPNVELREWNLQTEVDDIVSFDIGIMPIADDPWSRGKCGFKLIQYMACGLPVVASPVGVNRDLVQNGKNGILAQSEDEWLNALSGLVSQPQRLSAMGAAGRLLVEQKFCLNVTAPLLLETISASISKGPALAKA